MTTAATFKESLHRSSPPSQSLMPHERQETNSVQSVPAQDACEAAVESFAGDVTVPVPKAYVDGCETKIAAPLSVRILAVLAVGGAAILTQTILLPITISLLMALTLRPLMRRPRKWGIPDAVTAILYLSAIVGVSLAGLSSVVEPARHWIESAPQQLEHVQRKLSTLRLQFSAITDASEKVKELTGSAGGSVLPVEMHESELGRQISLATSTGNALGTCLVVLVLTFFLLTSGDQLLNQVLGGLTRLSEKKRTVELVREVERGIATYLSTVTMINVGLGLVSGIGFWLLGVPNPALWGAMTFLFNYVPFFGPFVATVVLAFVSLLSFESVAYACVPPIFFIVISAIEGNILTPMIVGRSMSLNPIIVFVALIIGGWAWGLGGAILAVPFLAVTKIATDKFQSTQSIARLLAG